MCWLSLRPRAGGEPPAIAGMGPMTMAHILHFFIELTLHKMQLANMLPIVNVGNTTIISRQSLPTFDSNMNRLLYETTKFLF